MSENDQTNPYAVLPTQTEVGDEPLLPTVRLRGKKILYALFGLIALTCTGGLIAVLIDIESIVFTGPLLAIASVTLLTSELVSRMQNGAAFHLALFVPLGCLLFCVSVWALIFFGKLSPSDADRIGIDVACASFFAVGGMVSLYALTRVATGSVR